MLIKSLLPTVAALVTLLGLCSTQTPDAPTFTQAPDPEKGLLLTITNFKAGQTYTVRVTDADKQPLPAPPPTTNATLYLTNCNISFISMYTASAKGELSNITKDAVDAAFTNAEPQTPVLGDFDSTTGVITLKEHTPYYDTLTVKYQLVYMVGQRGEMKTLSGEQTSVTVKKCSAESIDLFYSNPCSVSSQPLEQALTTLNAGCLEKPTVDMTFDPAKAVEGLKVTVKPPAGKSDTATLTTLIKLAPHEEFTAVDDIFHIKDCKVDGILASYMSDGQQSLPEYQDLSTNAFKTTKPPAPIAEEAKVEGTNVVVGIRDIGEWYQERTLLYQAAITGGVAPEFLPLSSNQLKLPVCSFDKLSLYSQTPCGEKSGETVVDLSAIPNGTCLVKPSASGTTDDGFKIKFDFPTHLPGMEYVVTPITSEGPLTPIKSDTRSTTIRNCAVTEANVQYIKDGKLSAIHVVKDPTGAKLKAKESDIPTKALNECSYNVTLTPPSWWDNLTSECMLDGTKILCPDLTLPIGAKEVDQDLTVQWKNPCDQRTKISPVLTLPALTPTSTCAAPPNLAISQNQGSQLEVDVTSTDPAVYQLRYRNGSLSQVFPVIGGKIHIKSCTIASVLVKTQKNDGTSSASREEDVGLFVKDAPPPEPELTQTGNQITAIVVWYEPPKQYDYRVVGENVIKSTISSTFIAGCTGNCTVEVRAVSPCDAPGPWGKITLSKNTDNGKLELKCNFTIIASLLAIISMFFA